jgi:hypothetical protein
LNITVVTKRHVDEIRAPVFTTNDLLHKYQDTLDSLYKQALKNPDNESIQTDINEIENKKIKILKLQLNEMENKLGYTNL